MHWEPSLGLFIILKICIIPYKILVFRYFSLYTGSLLNLFFWYYYWLFHHLLTNKTYLSKKKYVSKKYALKYEDIFWRNMHKILVFSINVINKIFETLFTKKDLIRYYYFINILFFIEIRLLCWWSLCFSVSVSTNFIIFYLFSHTVFPTKFLYMFFLIYSFPRFHLN